MRVECQSCGATYDTVQRDGTEYYHACAPLSVAELRAGLAAGTVALPPDQAARLAALDKLPPSLNAPAGTPAPGDFYLAQLVVERPNKRDENVRIDPNTRGVTLIAAGAGALEVVTIE